MFSNFIPAAIPRRSRERSGFAGGVEKSVTAQKSSFLQSRWAPILALKSDSICRVISCHTQLAQKLRTDLGQSIHYSRDARS